MDTQFLISSETYAEKTKRVLERAHIRWRVQRFTAPEGCTFRFTVPAPPAVVYPLLQAARIPVQAG